MSKLVYHIIAYFIGLVVLLVLLWFRPQLESMSKPWDHKLYKLIFFCFFGKEDWGKTYRQSAFLITFAIFLFCVHYTSELPFLLETSSSSGDFNSQGADPGETKHHVDISAAFLKYWGLQCLIVLIYAFASFSLGNVVWLFLTHFYRSPEDELKQVHHISINWLPKTIDAIAADLKRLADKDLPRLEKVLTQCYKKLDDMRKNSDQPKLVVSCDSMLLDKHAALPTTLLFINNQAAWCQQLASDAGRILPAAGDGCTIQHALQKSRNRLERRMRPGKMTDWTFTDENRIPIHSVRFFVATDEELIVQSDIFGRFLSGVNKQWRAGILNIWISETAWNDIQATGFVASIKSWWWPEVSGNQTVESDRFYPMEDDAKRALERAARWSGSLPENQLITTSTVERLLKRFYSFIPDAPDSSSRKVSPDFLIIGTSGVKGYTDNLKDDGRPAFFCALCYALLLLHHKGAIMIEPVIDRLLEFLQEDRKAELRSLVEEMNSATVAVRKEADCD